MREHSVGVRRMKLKPLQIAGWSSALLVSALVVASAQAGAAQPDGSNVKQTAKPVVALAMDGARVVYMRSDRRVGVWNVATGVTSTIKGAYAGKGRTFGHGTGGEVAIAGRRVALITRFETGNTMQTQERLYTASLGGSARQLGKLTNHSSSPGDCTVQGTAYATGDWLGGLVGSGNFLAVSRWKANDAAATGARLNLVGSTGLRTIATGPDAVVSQAAGGAHIAVLRSTDAWPAYQGPAGQRSPLAGVYSTAGRLLGEVALNVPLPNPCGYPSSIVRIALSGNRLVVLRLDVPQAGSLTSTVEVYDWTTGALVHVWPLALGHGSPGSDRLAASGRVAVIGGDSFRLRLLDLTTGRAATIAASHASSPVTLGSRGLVYGGDPYSRGRSGTLVFVPKAKLLAALSR
jgi:hypothetical protein